MWHRAWGWEGHVDARWRLRRRSAFNGSMVQFRLVVGVVGDLIASFCLLFLLCVLMVCWWCCLDLKLYVIVAPLVCEWGCNCVSFVCVLFVTVVSLGLWWMLPFCFVWRAFASSLYSCAGYLLFWFIL